MNLTQVLWGRVGLCSSLFPGTLRFRGLPCFPRSRTQINFSLGTRFAPPVSPAPDAAEHFDTDCPHLGLSSEGRPGAWAQRQGQKSCAQRCVPRPMREWGVSSPLG